MKINQVSVEITMPDWSPEGELSASITFSPDKPGSTHVWLPKSDLTLEQLRIVGDFVNRLSLFGEKAQELVNTIIMKE